MRPLLVLASLCAVARADGDHLSGDWGGARTWLAAHGVTFDIIYTAEAFAARGDGAALGHIDVAVTVDHPWPGAQLYALAHNHHGESVDIGSATQVSNLEAPPYTQLSELFLEQALGDGFSLRIGKQDANRDFGTPRFSGNFINNNFGMFPTAPLPSYPTTGMGLSLGATHTWLAARAALYEGTPTINGFGLDTAFRHGGGYILAGLVAATQELGGRDTGTQSVGVWRQSGPIAAVDGSAHSYGSDSGFYVQLDERFYRSAERDDQSGLNLVLRFSWAQADRTDISRNLGGSIAYHGLGTRRDDTIGIGVGYFTVAQPTNGSEEFVEAFYKWRVTAYASLQPDLELYHHPSGINRDAILVGARLKLKI